MRFTETHEWIVVKNGLGTVGISDHAQHELGDIVYVELPKIGKIVKAGEEVAVLESTKAAADIYSPVSGEIAEVNQSLIENPDQINIYPETNGWIYKIKLANSSEVDELLEPESYEALLRGRL